MAIGPTVSLPALQDLIICRCGSSVGQWSMNYLLQHLMPQLRLLQLPQAGISSRLSTPFLGALPTPSTLLQELNIDLGGLTHESITDRPLAFPYLQTLMVIDGTDGSSASKFITIHLCPQFRQRSWRRLWRVVSLLRPPAPLLNCPSIPGPLPGWI
ncbi:hypothetical protein B0H13DRAFT_2322842 [Mycena leptocephala]|nr:hypothetical protein B0H13DRAFT_2322842 [Mycena leptocephala]